MSILIKGMEMPKEISSNSHKTITLVIGSDGLVYDVNRNRLPAVAVEVPEPHGRLIDAEVVNSALKKRLLAVDTAPTVIEAEGEK